MGPSMDPDKMKAWWEANGGLSVTGYSPEDLAKEMSLKIEVAKGINDKFLKNLKIDLAHMPDEILRSFKDGHYLVELKKTLGTADGVHCTA